MIPVVRIIRIKKYASVSNKHKVYAIIRNIVDESNLATLESVPEAIKHIEDMGWILQPDEVYSFAGGYSGDY